MPPFPSAAGRHRPDRPLYPQPQRCPGDGDGGSGRCQGRREHLLWRGAVLLLPHGGGPGSSCGPDLSSIASRLRLANMQQALTNPGSSASSGGGGGFGAAPATYNSVTVVLKDGSKLQGLNRAQGSHDLVLQTRHGKLHLLQDGEYLSVVPGQYACHACVSGNCRPVARSAGVPEHAEGSGVERWPRRCRPSRRPRSTRSRIPGRGIGRATTAPWTETGTARSIRSTWTMRQSSNCSGCTRSTTWAWRRRRWWWMG